jgi:NAD(P)-dependent dehydrogenase (short-subunit alcohol dehydrogenase family)
MHPSLKSLGFGLGAVALAVIGGRALLRRSRWFDYSGQRVVVTGGARGLGLVLARQLAAAGARVAICSRTERELKRAAADLREMGADVIAQRCDVRDREQVEQFIGAVTDAWDGVDLLFNVAGVIEVGPLDAMTSDDFHASRDTHCWGVLHTTLAVLPTMRQSGWGRIVNIASLGGKRAVPHMLPYTASKFALVGLSTGLRAELAPDGILVTTVCPGLMRTGSPRNATFKGQHRKEYAWFSIGDSLPVVSMNAESAARQILLACQRGDAEIVLGVIGKIGLSLQSMAPNLAAEVATIIKRMLPAQATSTRRGWKGHQSQSAWSPSLLTHLGDTAAELNNERPPTK